MHSVTNPRPVAKVSSQAIIATSRRPIIGTATSSYPPRVTLITTTISATSKPSKIDLTSAPIKLSLSLPGLSQDAVGTALCDDLTALCDDTVILAGEYVDYSDHPFIASQKFVPKHRVGRLVIAGVSNG